MNAGEKGSELGVQSERKRRGPVEIGRKCRGKGAVDSWKRERESE
jgi:hypothetical protein